MPRTKAIKNPTIIQGGKAVDDRGVVSFVNDFDFKGVKRFYQVENFNKNTIRAFHGHKKESKYVYVVSGAILLYIAKLDNFDSPRKDLLPKKYVLSENVSKVLYIPSKHANGFKALKKDTKVIFFSTSTLKDSEESDDFRYPWDYWGKDIWKVQNK